MLLLSGPLNIALFSLSVLLAGARDRPAPGGGGFSLYVHAFMDQEKRPSLRASAEIPYDNLIFLRKKNVFEAAFELFLRIKDSKGQLVETVVEKKRVIVASYEATNSRKESSKLSQVFLLEPGSYTVEATLAIKETHLRFRKDVKVVVPNFLSGGVGLSSPRLFAVPREKVPRMVPIASAGDLRIDKLREKEYKTFSDFDKQPAMFFEVYTEKKDVDSIPCEIYFEVVDHRKRQLLYGKEEFKLSGLKDAFLLSFIVDEWEPGAYSLNLKAVLKDPPREAATSLRFTVEFSRAMLGKYFEQTLVILSLIASSEELEELKTAPYEERPRAWSDFWKNRDPTPGTEANEALEEHLRRVRYVMVHFSSLEPGWKTDRGRVYIKYGEPDQIDNTIDAYLQGEYQIWKYFSKNLVFVFYDRFGLGDYRLISTSEF